MIKRELVDRKGALEYAIEVSDIISSDSLQQQPVLIMRFLHRYLLAWVQAWGTILNDIRVVLS